MKVCSPGGEDEAGEAEELVGFFAHVLGFFTDDAVGCQKTYTLFSHRRGVLRRPLVIFLSTCGKVFYKTFTYLVSRRRRTACPM